MSSGQWKALIVRLDLLGCQSAIGVISMQEITGLNRRVAIGASLHICFLKLGVVAAVEVTGAQGSRGRQQAVGSRSMQLAVGSRQAGRSIPSLVRYTIPPAAG